MTTPGMSVSSGGKAYALTGEREKELEQYVGQRVEITGTMEHGKSPSTSSPGYGAGAGATTGAASGTTSGTTAGTTSGTAAGAPSAQRVGDLSEIKIVSFKSLGACSAQ